MNCKGIQAAIDSASSRNPISSEIKVHLNGCPDCRSYSDQTNSLLALLSVQPRVQAPADFDFRLRARIARAQAEPASPFAFLENLFGRTFSLKQAAASLAALAVMAAGTTLYFNQSNSKQADNSSMIASNIPAVVQPAPKQVEMPVVSLSQIPASQTSAPIIKSSAKPQMHIATMKPAVLAEVSNTDVIRVYNREKGHVSEFSKGGVYYGAESSAQLVRPASFGSF
ncbi:MAG: hypothetical protein JST85_02880 [Acidobacteria bacterium]|nr:hypothetical protein [Acidobacteriota bacterium]